MAEYNQIRAEIHNWSLESDDRLFRKIEIFAQNFLNKVDYVTADVKNTDFNINCSHVELGNAFSKFLNLSNHKFTENKMQPFNDADLLRKSQMESDLIPLSMDTNANIVERYQQALTFGMDNVNIGQYLNQVNDDDDRLSVSDAGERSYSIYSEGSILPGRNNKLPYIIGTRAFLEDDYIGIYENPEQPIKPELLSFQEISLQESNIKVESNYIPKIEQPPPISQPQGSESLAQNQNNPSANTPPPLLNTNGILVNQSAPPPPSLLLPGIKPTGPPTMNPGNNQPPPLNFQPQAPTQQGNSKVIAPPPLNLLLANQGKPANSLTIPPPVHNNSMSQNPPPLIQNPMMMQNQQNPMMMPSQQNPMMMQNPMMAQNQGSFDNPPPQNTEPLSIKDQLQAMLMRGRQTPAQPQDQPQSNQMMGQPQNMNMMMGNQVQMPGQSPSFSGMNMGQQQQTNQSFMGQQQMNYTYKLSESQIPVLDFNQPVAQNQNYYQAPPQNYQTTYPVLQQQQPMMQQQNFQQPQMKIQPPPPSKASGDISVSKKAPPPPNLLNLIAKDQAEKKNDHTSPSKGPSKPPMQKPAPPFQQPASNNQPPLMMNQGPSMMIPNQGPQMMPNQGPPMMMPPANTGMTLQEQLNAALRKKQEQNQPQNSASQPQVQPTFQQQQNNYQFQPNPLASQNQSTTIPPKELNNSAAQDSQFKQSLKALQETSTPIDNSTRSREDLKAQLERTLARNMNSNQIPTERTQTQTDPVSMGYQNPSQQSTLTVPGVGRPSLKSSKSVDVDKLQSMYKPKKKKNNLFDDVENKSESSEEEKNAIFRGENRKNTKFEDLLVSKPIIILPPEEKPKQQIPTPLPPPKEKEDKPTILENGQKIADQMNARKIEDSFLVTKSNDILSKNKDDLLEKSKVQEVKKDKFSTLFANDSDEEDNFKKTEDMKKLYAQEKVQRSKTALPSTITESITIKVPAQNPKKHSLFNDDDSEEDQKPINLIPPKPILKEKKEPEKEEDLPAPFQKKASVRFNFDKEEDSLSKLQEKEKVKKPLFFEDDDDQPKKKQEEQPVFNPPVKKEETFNPLAPVKKEETFNPLATKKSPLFSEDSMENYSAPRKLDAPNPESNRPSNKAPLNFLDEPSESLGGFKKAPIFEEERKPVAQAPTQRPIEEKPVFNPLAKLPSKKPFENEELFGKPPEQKPVFQPTGSNKKGALDFLDEPSEGLTFQKKHQETAAISKPVERQETPIFKPVEKQEEKPAQTLEKPSGNTRGKSPLAFLDEPSEALKVEKKPPVENSREKSTLAFLDEPSEALKVERKPVEKPIFSLERPSNNPIVRAPVEEKPSNLSNPLIDTRNPLEGRTSPVRNPLEDRTTRNPLEDRTSPIRNPPNETSEALGMEKQQNRLPEKPKEESTFAFPSKPQNKKALGFLDEPSEALGREERKPAPIFEKPKEEQPIFLPKQQNKSALAFLDESSEALGMDKKPVEKPREEPLTFPQKPQNKAALAFLDEPSEALEKPKPKIIENKPLVFEPKQQILNENKSPIPSQKDIFGGALPPNKKPLNFLDDNSESLGFTKTKSEKIPEQKKEPEPEPTIKSKTLKFLNNDNDPSGFRSVAPNSQNPLVRPSEKRDLTPKNERSSIQNIWPPPQNPAGNERPSKTNKEEEHNSQPSTRNTKNVTNKIQGLADKLGNLPMGGMFQKPGEAPMNRLPKKDDRPVELDHDLTLEKPTMARKKRPRGQKATDFSESEKDKNLQFERQNNAVVFQPPEENQEVMKSSIETSQTRISKQPKSMAEERTFDSYSKTQQQGPKPPLPSLTDDFSSKKKQPAFDSSEDFGGLNFRPSQPNKGIAPPRIDNSTSSKKQAKTFNEEDEDLNLSGHPILKPQHSNPLPKLPDLSDDRQSHRKKEPKQEKFSQEPIVNPLDPGNKALPPLPSISEDKNERKKKKHPLDRPSDQKPQIEEKKSRNMFDDDDNEGFSKPSLTKGKANNFDVPPLPGKAEGKAQLPDFKAPNFVVKPGEKESKKLKKLFDDDDDDGDTLFKPNRPAYGNNAGGGMSGKKKNMFD